MAAGGRDLSALEELKRAIGILLLCAFYAGASSFLGRFDQFLLDPGRFPFPLALSCLRLGGTFVICLSLFSLRPAAFPGMGAGARKRTNLWRWFVPAGILYGISLFAARGAEAHGRLTFMPALAFLQACNFVVAFLVTCIVGLQAMNRVRIVVVLWMLAFSVLAADSDLMTLLHRFLNEVAALGGAAICLCMQLSAQVAECCHAAMGECLMGGPRPKLDPLTFTMLASLSSFGMPLAGLVWTWDPDIVWRAADYWHFLLANVAIAAVLNLTTAAIIKETSAMGFVLLKDTVLVIVLALAFGEVPPLQKAGFVPILGGAVFWSVMHADPRHPVVRFVEECMGLEATPEERPGRENRQDRVAKSRAGRPAETLSAPRFSLLEGECLPAAHAGGTFEVEMAALRPQGLPEELEAGSSTWQEAGSSTWQEEYPSSAWTLD